MRQHGPCILQTVRELGLVHRLRRAIAPAQRHARPSGTPCGDVAVITALPGS